MLSRLLCPRDYIACDVQGHVPLGLELYSSDLPCSSGWEKIKGTYMNKMTVHKKSKSVKEIKEKQTKAHFCSS